jgi:ATP-dependent Clp protease ATP-binding subunit ClpC
LRRAIQTYVDDALADALLAGEIASDREAVLTVQDGKIVVSARETVPNVQ